MLRQQLSGFGWLTKAQRSLVVRSVPPLSPGLLGVEIYGYMYTGVNIL